MDYLLSIFRLYSAEVLAGMLVVFPLILGIALFLVNRKLKAYQQLTKLLKGGNVEELIVELDRRAQSQAQETASIVLQIKSLTAELSGQPHNWSIYRFNAFGSTGGDLSFSLAMVNDDGDGFVLSSIYGREESRMYAKPLRRGKSSYTLSEEEKKAIQTALRGVN